MAGGRAVETSSIFVFRMTFYVHRGSCQVRVHPRRWLSLSSRAKALKLKGRHRRFVGDSAVHTSLRGAPLLVAEQKKWYEHVLQKVQNLVRHDYIKSFTWYYIVYTVWCTAVCTCRLLLFSSNSWCKYSSRSLYYSPKQEGLLPVTMNASRKVC